MPPPPGPPPGPLGKPPGSAGGPPPVGGAAGPPPGSVARGVPGGGAKPKASAAPDWRNKLPATNAATTVMQVPAVSATGRTQWQPSSTFTPSTEPEPLSQPELEPEPEQEPGQPTDGSPEDEESDDEMFAAFADNYHRQVKQITPDVSPEKDTAVQLATEGSIAARDAAAAARGERAADLASGKQAAGAAGSGAVEDTLEEDAVVTSGNEISEEEAQRLAEEEAAATARAAAEDEEEEAAVEAADALDTPVALGFAENCDDFPHELDPEYFPSKIGGHAAWLHPMGIPVDKNRCPHCAAPMTFLLQIYTGGPGRAFAQPGAFHRTLFLYTCRSSACHARKPPDGAPFRLWRSQLPLKNAYYSSKAPEYGVHRPPISIEELASPTNAAAAGSVETIGDTGAALPCSLCGNPATKRCSGCKEAVYCCEEHQREDWRLVHKLVCRCSKSRQLAPPLGPADIYKKRCKWSLSEWELVVENEPGEKSLSAPERAKLRQYNAKKKPGTGAMGDELTEEDQRDMEGLRADDPARDPALLQFQLRVARAPDQVVRYRLGGPPLWAGRQYREHRPTQVIGTASSRGNVVGTGEATLQPCGRCGAPRQYEFQVQPQLLHYLTSNGGSGPCDNLDWAVVACYTCSASCDPTEEEGPYVEEAVWRQPGHELQPGRTPFSSAD